MYNVVQCKVYVLCLSVQSGSEEERSGGSAMFGESEEEEGEEGEESSGSETETERNEREGGEASSEEEVSNWLID